MVHSSTLAGNGSERPLSLRLSAHIFITTSVFVIGLVSTLENTSIFELPSVVGVIVTSWISTPVSLLFVDPDEPPEPPQPNKDDNNKSIKPAIRTLPFIFTPSMHNFLSESNTKTDFYMIYIVIQVFIIISVYTEKEKEESHA